MSARPNRRLRQAQEALRQALERGASDEELKKLMDQLRAALDKFLQALAEEMRKNPQQLARPLDRNTRMLSPQDLKSMLDRLENLARSGNKDAARQLLEELQSMLENLQMARPGAQWRRRRRRHDVGARRTRRHDPQAAAIARQDLQAGSGSAARPPARQRGQGQQQLGDLRQDQQGLRDRLNKLLEQLRQRGLGNPRPAARPGRKGQGKGEGDMDQLGERRRSHGRGGRRARRGRCRRRGRQPGPRARSHAQGRARHGAAMQQNGMGMGPGPASPAATAARAPSRTPIRSAGRCAAANMATTSP